jgi:hypothetical protein
MRCSPSIQRIFSPVGVPSNIHFVFMRCVHVLCSPCVHVLRSCLTFQVDSLLFFFELSSNALRRQVGVEIKTERASKRIIHGRSVTTLVLLEAFGSSGSSSCCRRLSWATSDPFSEPRHSAIYWIFSLCKPSAVKAVLRCAKDPAFNSPNTRASSCDHVFHQYFNIFVLFTKPCVLSRHQIWLLKAERMMSICFARCVDSKALSQRVFVFLFIGRLVCIHTLQWMR